MEKTDKILLLETQRKKPIGQIIAELERKGISLTARAHDLRVSTVTYRAWREAFAPAEDTVA